MPNDYRKQTKFVEFPKQNYFLAVPLQFWWIPVGYDPITEKKVPRIDAKGIESENENGICHQT